LLRVVLSMQKNQTHLSLRDFALKNNSLLHSILFSRGKMFAFKVFATFSVHDRMYFFNEISEISLHFCDGIPKKK
jgi:hypothetical protein